MACSPTWPQQALLVATAPTAPQHRSFSPSVIQRESGSAAVARPSTLQLAEQRRTTLAFGAIALGAAAWGGRRWRNRRCGRDINNVTKTHALRVQSATDAFFFADFDATGTPVPLTVAEAPATAAGAGDVWVELTYLAGNPFQRRIQITSSASAELEGVEPADLWTAFSGGGASSSLPAAWERLQLTQCYGIQAPLELQGVRGSLEEQAQIDGTVAVFGQEVRRFRWKVDKISQSGSACSISLLGEVVDDDAAVSHTLEFKDVGNGTCKITSQVQYAPSPPFQTFINAAGGRSSVAEGNKEVVKRLCAFAAGKSMGLDTNGFYNTVGKALDLMAPFEDAPRARLAELAGLSAETAGEGKRVLELGCGTGRWAKDLLEGSAGSSSISKYLGVDAAENMACIAAQELGKLDAASTVCADVRDLDTSKELRGLVESWLGGPPDRIVAMYIFDILDEADSQTVLGACAGWLRESGGSLVITNICEGGPVMSAWQGVWSANPILVGGCQPIDMAQRLKRSGWTVESQETMSAFGYMSQVLVARPPAS
mmetsp:Transcript_24216/g.56230  ORF Transcript_24216/g.56230 Transcript_24216/m.56230 type:complete len:542 (-) Transcript_24216:64-1689(-)